MDVLAAYVTPLFRGVGDIFTFQSKNPQVNHRCGDIELDALECIEAYGLFRGRKICEDYVQDYRECVLSLIQVSRVNEMNIERAKQLMRGERKIGEYYDDIHPMKDAFISGPFYN